VPHRPRPRAIRLVVGAALATGLTVATAIGASADNPVYPSQRQVDAAKAAVKTTAQQVSDLESQYAAASSHLEAVRMAAAAAAEAYNGARYQLELRTRASADARARAAAAQQKADVASLRVRQYAALVYQQGGSLGELEAFVSSNGPQDLLDRAASLAAVAEAQQRIFKDAAATSSLAGALRRQAAVAEAQQLAAAQQAEKAKNAAQAQADRAQAEATRIQGEQHRMAQQMATLRKTSVQVEQARQDGLRRAAEARAAAAEAARQAKLAAERAAKAQAAADRRRAEAAQRAAEEAARQAATAAAAAARDAAKPSSSPAPPPRSSVSGGVAAVIAYARAQIGKPYQWGADGPSTFDCSGLTMMAWRQAGVYLTHYTGAQWAETRHVPVSEARPGDLVFYGSSGATSHHVGLYVGGGQMIEAPYTGAYVRYASIWRSDLIDYVGRP
jgi:peptidoglycan DL-endopeptidase CwlO